MNIPQVFYSSVDRLLGCFQFGAIVHKVAVNICVQIYLWIYAFMFLLQVEFLDHKMYVSVCLTL